MGNFSTPSIQSGAIIIMGRLPPQLVMQLAVSARALKEVATSHSRFRSQGFVYLFRLYREASSSNLQHSGQVYHHHCDT